jgi:hypothetical protein
VGFAKRPELILRDVDYRREQQSAIFELLETQKFASELSADTDLPALSYPFELWLHDCMIA